MTGHHSLSRPSLRPLAGAVFATAATMVSLPFLQVATRRPEQLHHTGPVEAIYVPPETKITLPSEPAVAPEPVTRVQPEFSPPAPALTIHPVFDLGLEAGDFSGMLTPHGQWEVSSTGGSQGPAVFALDALDQAPVPIVQLKPIYPAVARLRGIEGSVMLEFTVDINGETRDITIVERVPSDIFDAAAQRAIERWRFNPGRRGGTPVAVRVRQRVTFSIDEAGQPF